MTSSRFAVVAAAVLAAGIARGESPCASGEDAAGFRREVAKARSRLSPEERAMVDRVVTRIAAAARTDRLEWPPQVEVVRMELNAFATCLEERGVIHPLVVVAEPMLTEVAKGHEERLALVVAHEFGHLALGHVLDAARQQAPIFARLAYSRDAEFAADAFAAEAVVRAGYPLAPAVEGARIFYELLGSEGPIGAATQSHPSWSERLERLDRAHATLWRASAAFETGVYLLLAERYDEAAGAFERVVKDFPDAAEAHADLGYARLMRYLDGLGPEDVRERRIGQLALGSFYRTPAFTARRGSGLDAGLWARAVKALERAAALDPRSAVAQANLAVAMLVAPAGARSEEAVQHAEEATRLLRDAPALAVAPILVNVGVVLEASGRPEAPNAFRAAEQVALAIQKQDRRLRVDPPALLYHRAMSGVDAPAESAKMLEAYLSVASARTPWWSLAYARYDEASRQASAAPRSREAFRAGAAQRRPVVSVAFRDGRQAVLGEKLDEALKRLGPAAVIGGGSSGGLRRAELPQRGLAILATDTVAALSLSGPRAPAVEVPERGIGGAAGQVRVGMTGEELVALLGPADGSAQLVDPARTHLLWPAQNLAIAVEDDRVAEILVIPLP